MTVGRELARAGFAVATGGGGGIMEAANRGAALAVAARSECRSCCPSRNRETTSSSYRFHSITFRRARRASSKPVTRSSCLRMRLRDLDELFEVLTLIQTGKTEPLPVIFLSALTSGRDCWSGSSERQQQRAVSVNAISTC